VELKNISDLKDKIAFGICAVEKFDLVQRTGG
jgi:hypothetical protein